MNPAVRTALWRSVAPISLMGLIFFLSGQPDLRTGLGIWDTIGRKVIHVCEYAVLTALWYRALRPLLGRPFPLAAAICLLYAVTDEYHQTFVHGREGTPRDVAIDLVGVLIVACLLRYDRRVRSALGAEWENS